MGFYKILASSYRLTNIFSSKNFRKIIIFIFIGLALFLLFSNNVFATENENVDMTTVNGLAINKNYNYFSEGSGVGYIKMEPGYTYTITNNSQSLKNVAKSVDIPSLYGEYQLLAVLEVGDTYSCVSDGDYLYLDGYGAVGLLVTRTPMDSFSATTNKLVNEFSPTKLWGQVGFAIPLIGVAVLFGLGFFIVSKVTKGESKSKVKF